MCTPAGWAGECRITYTWPDAEAKARAALAYVKDRSTEAGVPVEEWWEEYFGVNGFGGPTVRVPGGWDPPEVTGRLAWRTANQVDAARPTKEVGVLGLSGPPGISGLGRGGGATRPTQLLAVDPFFVDREIVDAQVRVDIQEM